MTYIHIAHMGGKTIDFFRSMSSKTAPPAETDGLIAMTAGAYESGVHVLSIWESKAHLDRFEAEQLFPAFQAAGVASDIMETTTFTTFAADDLYIR